ncbi:MAG: heme lyase CcmF/NrfE family subunit [Proteobacteria bacterium]|nr:heme lyase CcmF/NrfE family subunit [Pseudomonadota bacterium]
MTAELGAFSLVLALVFSLAQAVLSAAGRVTGAQAFRRAGEGAALAAFLAVAAAFLALTAAFVSSDFSIAYVANNSHTDKPLIYKIAGVWGGHEGSLLLWCLALTGYGAAVALFGERLPRNLKSLTVASQGVLGVLFIGFAVFASNAFLRLPTPPVEGRSLNPLLQDPALALHPPFLYAGYVGLSVPFSLAVAALIEGRIDAAWARWVRPWTLAAWSLLTVGITLGAFWAYYELGWGGWWAWDPVENASFMPWLASAALLHSAVVTEKRGALPGWTVFLALLAFSFSMLGAFLVRSGILTSVHAFAVDPTRGVILVGIMLAAAGAGFGLFAWRVPNLAPGGVFAPISREASLVLNNLFLAVAAAVVFVGTLFPLLFEALHKTISIGPPYFNLTFAPLMGAALLVLPAGPLLAWKRADLKGVWQRLMLAAALAAGAAILTLALHAPIAVFAAIGVGLGVWVAVGALLEAAQRVRLFKAPLAESLRRVGGLPRGSWGMTLAHLGLGLFVMGAAYETAYRVEAAEVLAPGGSLRLGAYVLTLDSVVGVAGPNYSAERARISVTRANGAPVCKAEPERRYYPVNRQQTSEVGLCFKGLNDLYVVAGDARALPNGTEGRLIRAYWNPWVRLIFLGPLLMAIGGALSLSDRRLRLAAAQRAAPVTAEARA